MMRKLLFGILFLLASSCSSDRHVGERYRAERDLWQADWEYRNLSIRPQDVGEEQWNALAARYEAIAQKYAGDAAADQSAVREETRTIAARALFTAARVHGTLRDSIRVEQIFEEMAGDYADLSSVAAEVAMARGRIAESKGKLGQAADFYQSIIERIDPDPAGAGVAGAVMDLPLRIARLRSQGGSPDAAATHYQAARSYYKRLVGEHAGDLVQIDAQAHLAEVAADLGDWLEAVQALRGLETQLLEMDEAPRDPCEVRLAISGIQARTGADRESARMTLTSLLEDYPDCKLVPQALLALAGNADQRDQVDEALGYLDRITDEHKESTEIASRALLVRGALLERRERWAEALEAFRTIPVEYPISEAALLAPLEIAKHYNRVSDEEATADALSQAARSYRDFIGRYPPGPSTIFARERLVQVLALQADFDSAVTEMLSLGDDLVGTQKGASLLLAAARMAYADLADTARAATILDHVGELYAQADIGNWASGEAARLRESMTR